jgi:uncharacterized protein (TIGR02996 family)
MSHASFLHAIRNTPEDDTARLVYADYIEEEGDPARAEFIRIQITLARLSEDDPQRPALEDREYELLAEHERHWLGVPPDARGLTEWEFDRGFVNEVAATPYFMLGPGTDLCGAHPIRRWRVQGWDDNMPQDLLDAGQRGWFRQLEVVDLVGWYQTIGELERFLTRAGFERLCELNLMNLPGLDDLPDILARTPFRESLKILRCGGGYPGELGRLDTRGLIQALSSTLLTGLSLPACMLTTQELRELLVGNCCRELKSLDIRDNPIGPDGWEAFKVAQCRLNELDLSGTPLGGIALENVLRWASVSELRALELNRCGSAMANIRALAASRFWMQAEELRMHTGTIPERALEPLFTSSGPSGLRILDVSQNYFRDAGVLGLCGAPWASSLTWLGLSQNYLTNEAARTIASCSRFQRLRTLHLSNNNPALEGAEPHEQLTDVGLRTLAESPSLANLRLLMLSGTDITESGVEMLLTREHWRLNGLGLGSGNFSSSVVEILARSPRLARLEWLDLSQNFRSLRGSALLPLAESEYLSPLLELDIRGCSPDARVRDVFRQRLGHRLSE